MTIPINNLVCLFHALPKGSHRCVVCVLCYMDLSDEEAWIDSNGVKWDICRPCRTDELKVMNGLSRERKLDILSRHPSAFDKGDLPD